MRKGCDTTRIIRTFVTTQCIKGVVIKGDILCCADSAGSQWRYKKNRGLTLNNLEHFLGYIPLHWLFSCATLNTFPTISALFCVFYFIIYLCVSVCVLNFRHIKTLYCWKFPPRVSKMHRARQSTGQVTFYPNAQAGRLSVDRLIIWFSVTDLWSFRRLSQCTKTYPKKKNRVKTAHRGRSKDHMTQWDQHREENKTRKRYK